MVALTRRGLLGAVTSWAASGCAGLRDQWRAKPPPVAESIAVALPGFEVLGAPDGTAVYLAPRPGLEGVSLELVLDAGAIREPEGRGGLSQLLDKMLAFGTGGGDRAALAAAFGELGGDLYVHSEHDCLRIGTHVLASSAASALSLLGDVACYPTMPPAALERLKAQHTTELRPEARVLAKLAAFEMFLPASSPLANVRRTASEVDVELLRAMLAVGLTRVPRAVIVAGGFEPEPAAQWIGDMLVHLPPAGPGLGMVTPLPARSVDERVVLVDRGGQDVVLSLATLAPKVGAREEVPFDIAAGMVLHEITQELRERQGLAYGILGQTEPTPFGRMFWAWTTVEARSLAKALRRCMVAIEGARELEVSTEWARWIRVQGLVDLMNGFQTTSDLVRGARQLHLMGLPAGHYQQAKEEIENVEGEDVMQQLQQRFGPDALVLVLAGPIEVLRLAVAKALPGVAVKEMSKDRLM